MPNALLKLLVGGWKKTPVQVHYFEFCVISKTDYLVEHVQTVASDILGYPYVGYLLQGPYWGNAVFSSILTLIHFKLILESCTTSRVYLEPYQTSMMKRFRKNILQFLAVVFLQKCSRVLIGFCIRLCSLVFLYFSTFFVWILEWTIWTFCYYSESVQILSSHDLN